jgi:hypothetical protein
MGESLCQLTDTVYFLKNNLIPKISHKLMIHSTSQLTKLDVSCRTATCLITHHEGTEES